MKIFLPGPTEVHPDVLAAMAQRQIGHRTPELHAVMRRIAPGLKRLFGTEGHVFVGTCSATGALEAAVRNVVPGRLLNLECGAWGRRFGDIAAANGIDVDRVRSPWGEANRPAELRAALKRARYDAVAVVWCETSTGVLNPLAEIAAVVQEHEDVLLLVDGVSALGALPVNVDQLGVDVLVAGVQKALAVPPGLALFSVSGAALSRAETVKNRGFYLDFLRHRAVADKDETPSTPSTAHLFALDAALARVAAEGMPARAARHEEMAAMCRQWARKRFALFCDEGVSSPTVTCIGNPRGSDIPAFLARVRDKGCQLGSGYGELKGKTFRVGHMGEHRPEDIEELIDVMDACL
ncbi:MAG: alanine--glyoxylate aminotransferase family protein [Planctomycetes bacterium]|nr:alanine--glyoxylate aminotransferase family protein [Planctomycetota bacterium]